MVKNLEKPGPNCPRRPHIPLLSLFSYYRDKLNEAEIANDNGAINISIRNSKSFDYKTEITGSLDAGED